MHHVKTPLAPLEQLYSPVPETPSSPSSERRRGRSILPYTVVCVLNRAFSWLARAVEDGKGGVHTREIPVCHDSCRPCEQFRRRFTRNKQRLLTTMFVSVDDIADMRHRSSLKRVHLLLDSRPVLYFGFCERGEDGGGGIYSRRPLTKDNVSWLCRLFLSKNPPLCRMPMLSAFDVFFLATE